MPELGIGLAVGFLLAVSRGLDPVGAFVVGGLAALALYFASCFVFPFRRCWLCDGRTEVGDGRGNFRLRWTTCLWCRGARPNRRLGARLMGRG